MQSWIAWKRTILTFKLRTYDNLVVDIELLLTLKLYLRFIELFEIELFWRLTVCKQKQYLY